MKGPKQRLDQNSARDGTPIRLTPLITVSHDIPNYC